MAGLGGPADALVPCVAVLAHRPRVREAMRAVFPRRRTHLVTLRTAGDFEHVLRNDLVDAAIVDLGAADEDSWRAAALARELPSIPFFGIAPLRGSDGPTLARCAALEFVDVLVDGVDDAVTRDLIAPHYFSVRFARALADPPPELALSTAAQRAAWHGLVARGGRPTRTTDLAAALSVTREHLSRTFAAGSGANLKRVIDLVRLLAAAELAKNPGYDLKDVAAVLGFASASHLATTARRVVGTRTASLARLRTVDLVARFSQGRSRSRIDGVRES
ncbi:MAG: hypothetical protein NVS9B3_02130 [Gemmatimonadaceae bacterium]